MPKQLKVLLDLTPLGCPPTAKTGLARVAESLASALALRPEVVIESCAFGSVAASREFNFRRAEYRKLHPVPYSPSRLEQATIGFAEYFKTRSRLANWASHRVSQAANLLRDPLRNVILDGFNVVHSTYARFPRVVRSSTAAKVMTVHDITALRLPLALVGATQRAVTKRIIDSIQSTDWLAFVSDHARHDFLAYKKHPVERTKTIYNGVDHAIFRPPADTALVDDILSHHGLWDRPFVMTLSSMAAHKNLGIIAESWPQVLQRVPDARLLIAGGKTSDISALRDTTSGSPLGGTVLTGYIPDDQFAALASRCNAFLFPSLYEGFGLPPLEAMACGAPVIASNTTAIPEVVGGAGILLDPQDSNGWADAIEAALNTSVTLESRYRSTERAKEFDWHRAASEYAAFYCHAVENN